MPFLFSRLTLDIVAANIQISGLLPRVMFIEFLHDVGIKEGLL